LGNVFGETLAASGLGLAIPFALAAIFKTAQGSSTVAVISTASIIAPLLPSIGLDTEGGISKFSKIDTATTLRTHSVVSALMAAVAFLSVWVASFVIS
jgi:gluconate:H+ symporter, GntP family